mmetsp:Transcript_39381/g.69271  ORF Transcript_39381/g.69271 Transcript_39381/m.69271 type:complete len:443 (-) Transcript_39381:28-1356(-)
MGKLPWRTEGTLGLEEEVERELGRKARSRKEKADKAEKVKSVTCQRDLEFGRTKMIVLASTEWRMMKTEIPPLGEKTEATPVIAIGGRRHGRGQAAAQRRRTVERRSRSRLNKIGDLVVTMPVLLQSMLQEHASSRDQGRINLDGGSGRAGEPVSQSARISKGLKLQAPIPEGCRVHGLRQLHQHHQRHQELRCHQRHQRHQELHCHQCHQHLQRPQGEALPRHLRPRGQEAPSSGHKVAPTQQQLERLQEDRRWFLLPDTQPGLRRERRTLHLRPAALSESVQSALATSGVTQTLPTPGISARLGRVRFLHQNDCVTELPKVASALRRHHLLHQGALEALHHRQLLAIRAAEIRGKQMVVKEEGQVATHKMAEVLRILAGLPKVEAGAHRQEIAGRAADRTAAERVASRDDELHRGKRVCHAGLMSSCVERQSCQDRLLSS